MAEEDIQMLQGARAELASAQHLIVNYVPILNHHQLDTITMSFCAYFNVLENFGTNNLPAGLSRVEFFIMQFDAIISGCVDPNNIAQIHAATFYLQAQYEMIRLFDVV
uniref:Uncharacterized protein n=1 Tax=Globodera rostochiensis TaxID=31243 RepID=A0A914IBR6_GLORO